MSSKKQKHNNIVCDCFFFQAAISRKQAEALLFCKQELVTQLGEYLAHTPQTLSATDEKPFRKRDYSSEKNKTIYSSGDVKAVGEAEANERWERVISASLLTIDFIFGAIVDFSVSNVYYYYFFFQSK